MLLHVHLQLPTTAADMPLTDTEIRLAKARTKTYKLTDGGGLTLLVQPNGSKW
jgi:hypothetical protein